MGSGASSEAAAQLSAASVDEVKAAVAGLSDDNRQKLAAALKAAEGASTGKNLETAKQIMEIQGSLSQDITPEEMGQAMMKLLTFFAAELTITRKPDMKDHVLVGKTFGPGPTLEMMQASSGPFIGIKNIKQENGAFTEDGASVSVEQLCECGATDSGKLIEGSVITHTCKHSITFDADGKACKWDQEFLDLDKFTDMIKQIVLPASA